MAADGGGTDTEAGTTTEGESPPDDAACFAAGGRLDVISELWTSDAPPELANGLGHARGLVAHDDGLWALVAHTEELDGPVPQVYGFELDETGTSTQPAQPVPSEWSGRRVWQGPELVLLTGCHDLVPVWSFIDRHGTPLSASMTPSAPAMCDEPLSAAWVGPDEVLVTWVDHTRTCDDDASCVMLAHASPSGIDHEVSLHWAGIIGVSPNATVAAGANSALVTMLRRPDHGGIHTELVMTPVDFMGQPLASPVVVPLELPPFPAFSYNGARAVADDADGFFVFLGGLGPSMSRLHVDAEGRALEPLHELAAIETWPPGPNSETLTNVFQTTFRGLEPRPWGVLAYGDVIGEYGGGMSMAIGFDRRGEPVGSFMLSGDVFGSNSIASDGIKNWALSSWGGNLRLFEFGCVLDD